MYSKPSVNEMARLSSINILENVVVIPAREPENNEIDQAIANLINEGIPNHNEIDEILEERLIFENNLAIDQEDIPERQANLEEQLIQRPERPPILEGQANLEEQQLIQHPERPAILEGQANLEEQPRPEELILNDVDMVDEEQQLELERELLLIAERDLAVNEIQQTRLEIQQRLDNFLIAVGHCNDLLDVLNRRERVVLEQYHTMAEQERLVQILNRQ